MDDGKGLPPSFQDTVPAYEPDGKGGIGVKIPATSQSQKQEDETLYVECDCHDMDHLTQLWFESDGREFYLQYKLDEFPGKYISTASKQGESRFWFNVRCKVNRIKRYFRDLKNALIGRPQHFTGQAVFGSEEAIKITNFINRKLNVPTEQR